ncbi:ABC transporter permease [Chloroflexi bacterium TSY]|nr:ABC transporter permease [Chloroflexi bacterium TSY]
MRFALRLILPRTGLAILSLLAVSALTFTLVELLPGDPVTRVLGRDATPELVAVWRDRLNLDQPPVVRYALWVSSFARGDWGDSIVSTKPATEGEPGGRQMRAVADMVLPRLKNTLILAGYTLLLYIPLSLFLGIVTAVYRERRFTVWLSGLILLGTTTPDYVIGIFLLLIFAISLNWFPPLAMIDQAASTLEVVRMLTLPALTLTIAMTGVAVRMMQGSLLAVLDSDYVRFATLKGLSRRRVMLLHALPNALGPAVRATVLSIVWLVGGVVYVEVIFTFPGLGLRLLDSLRLLDTPVILAGTMILAALLIFSNLAADLLAAFLNPRLRGE